MNTITTKSGYIERKNRIRNSNDKQAQSSPSYSPGFKGAAPVTLITEADKQILNIFSQSYGNIPERIGNKLGKLASSSSTLGKTARFSLEKGVTSIKEKSIGRSLLENVIFPFVNIPLYTSSWILKQAQKIPINSVKNTAEKLYKSNFLRTPRKINEIDSKTDVLKGMYDKTKNTITEFAEKKGVSSEYLIDKLNKTDAASDQLTKEANEYIKESLYKVSNKFFDKNTGNFNTAYERPLNRIVSGLIPVSFLAADAYNLSVLCGDDKETSKKEARERRKQEISRVFTTAYIQLITLGAFTKQVNTISWFTPVTSAATVLFSEITSRKRLNKPIFFLTKDKAKEYNNNDKENVNSKDNDKSEKVSSSQSSSKLQTVKQQNPGYLIKSQSEPKIFSSFKSNLEGNPDSKEDKKQEEPKKALINFKTFRNGVIVLISAGFALSFLKNSSYTKNSKLIKKMQSIGKYFNEKVYKKLAFKDFEIKEKDFNKLTNDLKNAGCKEIAEGHEFIKNKYGKSVNGTIKMYQSSLSSSKIPDVVKSSLDKIKDSGISLNDTQNKQIEEAVRTAIKLENTAISENKYSDAAKKAAQIIQNKNVLSPDKTDIVTKAIEEAVCANVKQIPIQIETKAKPFVDIVIEPFKFIIGALKLPFKITSSLLKLAASPVEKKAKKAALGEVELSKFEKNIHKAVTEVFGEKEVKKGKISQKVFANAVEQLEKRVKPYQKAEAAYKKAITEKKSADEINKLKDEMQKAQKKLMIDVNTAVEKSFNGVTQSSNKNTDLALMSKISSSAVTSAFLVADNYNMVMLKSNGEDKEGAKEKANERIIQRLSALFYQSMLINWFNATFRSTYNSSLKGMTAVVIPNTLTTEILTRKSIGMPISRKSMEELQEIDEKNENRTGFAGKYFKFMRLLTGKKPLKDRLPKENSKSGESSSIIKSLNSSTNILEQLTNNNVSNK